MLLLYLYMKLVVQIKQNRYALFNSSTTNNISSAAPAVEVLVPLRLLRVLTMLISFCLVFSVDCFSRSTVFVLFSE